MPSLKIGKLNKTLRPALEHPCQRVYMSISSEGYGHSTRAIAIAQQLQRLGDNPVLIGTYGYAFDRVEQFGLPCVQVPQEIKFVGEQGCFDMGKTLFENQSRAFAFNQMVQFEVDIIKHYNISLVVADGRLAPVLAAARLDIPCVVLTNQSAFYPFFAKDSPFLQVIGHSFEWVMKFFLSSAEEILIPDFPPPHTVCLPNLSTNYQVKKRTRFVGPLLTFNPDSVVPMERTNPQAPLVVASLGGHSYRRPLFDALMHVARQSPEVQFWVMTPFEMALVPPNVRLFTDVMDAASLFKAADLVITQGGHSTAMELLSLGVPSLVVPDLHQIEQENNARRLVSLGVSESVSYEQLQADPLILKRYMDDMLGLPSYRQHAEQLAEESRKLNGAQTTAHMLLHYASRLLAY